MVNKEKPRYKYNITIPCNLNEVYVSKKVVSVQLYILQVLYISFSTCKIEKSVHKTKRFIVDYEYF